MAEILDALRRDGDSSNTIIGVVILVLLTVFTAPDILPQLVAQSIPFLEEGLPCEDLLTSQDRAYHQSLIGARATNPLTISTEVGNYPPNGAQGNAPFRIRIVVINNTIGTVPFVFDPEQVIIGDNNASSGVGLLFNQQLNLTLLGDDGLPNQRAGDPQTFPLSQIKLLGPRQRCVHVVTIPPENLTAFTQGQGYQVRSYYRIVGEGFTQQTNPAATPIYQSQNLRTISSGFIESAPVTFIVPVAVQANTEGQ